jgi:TolA-binding protein
MKKDLKRQIKHDEFVSGVGLALRWVEQHREPVQIGVVVVAAVALAVAAVTYFRGRQTEEAQAAFAEALETFHAPVAGEQPPPGEMPSEPTFKTPAEKYRKAAAAFDGVERRFGSTPAALRARYYAALSRIELGETAEAEKELADVASHKDRPLESSLARMALADLHRRTGAPDKAVEAYRQLLDDPKLPLPRDYALMGLAQAQEDAKKGADARSTYQRLVDEYPNSIYLNEAKDHLRSLENAG